MARRKKKIEEQMDIFEEGGLKDEGGTIDPVSGNDVPPGSTQSEVRDDIPAQLSEGEFVFPADVVRYIGLENLMELRQKAKMGLQKMEDMGQMGNSEEAIIDDDMQFDGEIDRFIEEIEIEETQNFAVGGMPQAGNVLTSSQPTPMATAPTTLPGFSSFVQQPAVQQAKGLKAAVESKEFIGPNGERVTIQFVNGQPATPVPEGYREMTAQEKEEAMKPKIAQPEVVQKESNREDPQAETATDPTMTALSQMKELGIVDDKIVDGYKKSANRLGLGAIVGGVAGVLSAPAAGEKIKGNLHEEIAKTMGMTKDQFEKSFVDTNFLGMTEKYKNLEDMKTLKDYYEERKPEFDSKSDEEKEALSKTAEKYDTLAWSEQTQMLKEQDDFAEDDDDNTPESSSSSSSGGMDQGSEEDVSGPE